MLFDTAIVVAVGIAQFAIGVAFAGITPYVGMALMNEGVNDLIYATTAFYSGYFSWQDYAKHKLRSVCLSVVTVGITGLVSKLAQAGRYAYQLYRPSLNAVARTVEGTQQVLNTVSGSMGLKQIATRVLRQTMYNMANSATVYMTETREQSECARLERECLAKPMEILNEHTVLGTLQQVYVAFGDEEAWAIVNSVSESTFTRKSGLLKYLSNIKNRMIVAISGKMKAKPVTRVSSHELSQQLAQICRVTDTLLNDLELKMKTKLDESELALESSTAEQTGGRHGYENFQKKVIARWEELLRGKIVEVIPEYGTDSTLKQSATLEKPCKDMDFRERFKNRKRQHKGMLERRDEEPLNSLLNHTQKYHKDLLSLMSKTRNPSLLAAIVRENIPMNYTCASACTFLACNVLLRRGVILSALKVVIEGENGMRQAFTYAKDGVVEKVISIRMQDNLYEVSASDSQASMDLPSTGRCLFEGLAKKIPGLHGGYSLRNEVADAIAIDPVLQYVVRQYYHSLPQALGSFGGTYHDRKKEVHEATSSTI
ncbi:hypothetical protein ZHAS_00001275 [Anopheles sinensis]|uniref:Uncharacterized protein n=1 Tax=Anopheles sinensis TaxID=74873 RepID=A0A084VB64_ANOSI|nr:hypothetical protein ZHAS_00001275 [Anopheles sinensis]